MAHRHRMIDNPGQVAGVAAIAAAVGAMTAIILTPRSGQETREEIRARAKNLREKMRRTQEGFDDTIDSAVGNVDTAVQSAHEHIRSATTKKPRASSRRTTKTDFDSSQDETDHIRRHGER